MGADPIIVLKIGGSLAEGPSLPRWLATLPAGRGHAVVVPGGGVFADAVRHEQQRLGFSDRAANRMALLAMEQYALALADLVPDLAPCRTIEEIRAALAAGRIPIWLPTTLALADPAIPESWEVTSDSLAAWLAGRLGARTLVLVKSIAAPRPLEPAVLAAKGMVDTAFPRFFRDGALALDWVGPGEEGRLADLLAA
ncbi:MAG: amino acid kinase [Alphaproteobacteria bacterium]|nr:amino acid kinase [Alphaproteobacteria bacterium]